MFIHPMFVNQWQTWLIILAVVLVLFGATKLPALSKSLGQSIKIFRKEMKTDAPTQADVADTAADADADKPSNSPADKS